MSDCEMITCPYNKSHVMVRKKYQQHIMKCRELYQDTVELLECPFNKSHLIPAPEFHMHTKSCSDRQILEHYKNSAGATIDEDTSHPVIETEENWDDEEATDYDPEIYASSANIVRNPRGMFPAERKAFIKEENERQQQQQ